MKHVVNQAQLNSADCNNLILTEKQHLQVYAKTRHKLIIWH